jgi:hypothetical protein
MGSGKRMFGWSGGAAEVQRKQIKQQEATSKKLQRYLNQVRQETLDRLNELPTMANVTQDPNYKSYFDTLTQRLGEQKNEDHQELSNNLNARNQLGGSFEALQRNLIAKRYDTLTENADTTARQATLNIYQTRRSALEDQLQKVENYQFGAQLPTLPTSLPAADRSSGSQTLTQWLKMLRLARSGGGAITQFLANII